MFVCFTFAAVAEVKACKRESMQAFMGTEDFDGMCEENCYRFSVICVTCMIMHD